MNSGVGTAISHSREVRAEGDPTDACGNACGGTNDTKQGQSLDDVFVSIQGLHLTLKKILVLLEEVLIRLPSQ
jgi:hypothetical protein